MQPTIPISPELVAILAGIVVLCILFVVAAGAGFMLYRRKSQSIPSYVDSLVANHRRRIAINEFLADAIEENDVVEKP